jgi:hypothetical protein
MKRALIVSVFMVLVFSVLTGMHAFDVAKANFVILPTKPITDQPTLVVQSPINNYSYSETSVPLNLTVIKPASWGPGGNASIYYDCGISYIHYSLDGTSYSLFQAQLINPIPQDLLPTISNFSESLKSLTNGAHSLQVTIYALSQWCPDNSGPYGTSIPPFYFYNMTVTSETIHFNVGLQATSSPSPTEPPTSAMTASLSESASALNYGSTVNFTVSADGGTPPYTYSWYMDSQLAQTSASPYYSTNNQTVGSHHVYVQVTDVDNNSATTLAVEFNVLPVSSTSTSLSPTLSNSPTQPEFTPYTGPTLQGDYADYTLFYLFVGIIALVIIITAIYIIVYFKKHHRQN